MNFTLSKNAMIGWERLVEALNVYGDDISSLDHQVIQPIYDALIEMGGVMFENESIGKVFLCNMLWLAFKTGQEKPYMKFG